MSQLPHCTIINGYGPTEGTTFTCCHTINAVDLESHYIPIGRAISNTQVYIVDAQLQPVPIGVGGELLIGGDGVGRGYWRRQALTAERFIANPFGQGRLYRSGDVARFGADGLIEFLGRLDQQVKIRGFRVEPAEIEMALVRHPAVQAAAVVAQDEGHSQKRLIAYVVSALFDVETTELRRWLADQLPSYMIPSLFMVLEGLPLSVNGKVDRSALPAPDGHRPRLEARYEQARSATEDRISEVWQGVLGLREVGVHDNFFDLGGHSLLMVQIQRQLQQALQKSISLIDLFEFPTIALLSSHLNDSAPG